MYLLFHGYDDFIPFPQIVSSSKRQAQADLASVVSARILHSTVPGHVNTWIMERIIP